MGAAVEADNRLAVEIFQGQRGEAEAFLTLQQSLSLRPLRFGNKGDGLLRRQRDLQRAVVGGQPEGKLGGWVTGALDDKKPGLIIAWFLNGCWDFIQVFGAEVAPDFGLRLIRSARRCRAVALLNAARAG